MYYRPVGTCSALPKTITEDCNSARSITSGIRELYIPLYPPSLLCACNDHNGESVTQHSPHYIQHPRRINSACSTSSRTRELYLPIWYLLCLFFQRPQRRIVTQLAPIAIQHPRIPLVIGVSLLSEPLRGGRTSIPITPCKT